MIMSSTGNLCLVSLLDGGPQYTYVTKNRLAMLKVFRKTKDVLAIMKGLERGGFVSSEKMGSGYFWRLTDSGRLKAKEVK